MKKQNKIYSASDFVSASASVVVENAHWAVDRIDFTRVGEFSKAPLFELELKRISSTASDVPEGYTDASMEMEPNRTYFVREGRPLYNALLKIWEAVDGEKEDFIMCAMRDYAKKAFRGRVERLSGVSYTTTTKRGTIIHKSSLEVWYPESLDDSRVLDDFVFLCNKGVYTPDVEEKKPEELIDITKVDPKVIAAIRALMK